MPADREAGTHSWLVARVYTSGKCPSPRTIEFEPRSLLVRHDTTSERHELEASFVILLAERPDDGARDWRDGR